MAKCEVILRRGDKRYGMECFDPKFDGRDLTVEIAKGVRVYVCRREEVVSIKKMERGGHAPLNRFKFYMGRPRSTGRSRRA